MRSPKSNNMMSFNFKHEVVYKTKAVENWSFWNMGSKYLGQL
jgi:hypothetical protein